MFEVGLQSLQSILRRASKEYRAIGHFNVSNLEMLRGVLEAAKKRNAPVMIGTSEGEEKFIGVEEAVALIQSLQEEYHVPIFLNADHHKSVEAAKAAIDAGYDSVHIDLSKLPYEENVNGTKEIVEYARSKGSGFRVQGSGLSIEGELGYLPTESSKIYREVIEIDPGSLTKPEEAARFVKETGVDRFSPAVGNLHGIAANEQKLDIERIAAIRKAVPEEVALVLHGGSGIPDGQIHKAIKAGMNNIHVSTELRVAYTEALRSTFKDKPEETTPYKLFLPAIAAIQSVVEEKLKLFGW